MMKSLKNLFILFCLAIAALVFQACSAGTLGNEGELIPVEGIALNKNNTGIVAGKSEQLVATVLPADATKKDVIWTSNDESKATVSDNGLVTAVAPGSAIVMASTADGSFNSKCIVKISDKEIPVTGISLNKAKTIICIYNNEQLSVIFAPDIATNQVVRWYSSNETMVTVSAGGIVRAMGEGTAMITVISDDGEFSADCQVKVTSHTPGEKVSCTSDNVTFKMVFVPGGMKFPTGEASSTEGTVVNDYWIGETEITYELWNKVRTWAVANGYYFQNNGVTGSSGSGDVKQPVTTINWRDAMVWCNAMTEWYNTKNGASFSCVYRNAGVPIRDSRNNGTGHATSADICDTVIPDNTARGFRLLIQNEWELAARWRDDSTNVVSGYSDPYFTTGNSASGARTWTGDLRGTAPNYAGKLANDAVAVYYRYSTVSGSDLTGVSGTALVASKLPDTLGLYDMSGNAWEWCFDLYTGYNGRIRKGGSWSDDWGSLNIGGAHDRSPGETGNNLGLRIGRTE